MGEGNQVPTKRETVPTTLVVVIANSNTSTTRTTTTTTKTNIRCDTYKDIYV